MCEESDYSLSFGGFGRRAVVGRRPFLVGSFVFNPRHAVSKLVKPFPKITVNRKVKIWSSSS
jgi:hypothetical protein